MFLQDIRMFSVAFVETKLDLYLSGLPDIFSRISDINNIFFLTRRRDILSGIAATEQDIFNSICGDKTGHFLRDIWIFASLFVVTKTDIFITTSEHFLVLFVETEPGILNIMSRWFFVHKPDQMMKRHHTQFRTLPVHRPWSSSHWWPGPWRGRSAASRWKDGPAAANSSHSRTRPHQEVPTQLRGEKVITVPH